VKRIVAGVAALALVLAAQAAEARNFHISGGIQYVIQGTKEKDKQNFEDAERIFGKAVVQLRMGIADDPKDDEAWDYLGRAYAELGKADSAGIAFSEALTRLAGKDDPKLLKRVEQNREHYWVQFFNDGLQKYREANDLLPVEQIPTAPATDTTAAAARAKLAEAEVGFRNAAAVWPERAKSYDNLAVVLALLGHFDQATATIEEGLAKSDSTDEDRARLVDRKTSLLSNAVVEKLKVGDYNGALELLDRILARNPKDYDALARAAQTSFEQGQKLKEAKDDAGALAAFRRSAEYFGRAAVLAPDAAAGRDMYYNQAVAAQNAGDDKAAAKILFALVQDYPKDASLHRMLRGAWDRMGSKNKASDHVWVILGLSDEATPVADIAAYTSKIAKTSAAGRILAEQGPPEEIRQFTSGTTSVDVWYYWAKKRVYAFSNNQLAGSANFGEFGPENGDAASQPAAGAKKKG
jgi:tetratricopeptide (TPR) repeat protein